MSEPRLKGCGRRPKKGECSVCGGPLGLNAVMYVVEDILTGAGCCARCVEECREAARATPGVRRRKKKRVAERRMEERMAAPC